MDDACRAPTADVLVVGAGPVGLSLAIELGRRGISTCVIEQNDRVGYQPRAKTTNVRTMAHMRRWGLAEEIRQVSPLAQDYPRNVIFATRLFGYPLARFENAFYGSRARNDLFCEPAEWIPQYVVEGVLRRHVETLTSVALRFNTRFETASQSGDSITAEVTDLATGQRRSVKARYLVGADGARSRVRQVLGISMEGEHAFRHHFNIIIRAPSLAAQHPQAKAIMYWLVNQDSPAVLSPLEGDTWAFGTQLAADEIALAEPEIRRRVTQAVGRDIDFDVLATDRWAAHRLIANRYHIDRVLLAGDACHLHPPYGGYGMNMGVGDAVDLGWKLSASLQGWGGTHLLESYEAERRPVHERVIKEAIENHSNLSNAFIRDALEQDGPDGEDARRNVAAEILRIKEREFKTLGVVLGYHYSGSAIVMADGTTPPSEHFGRYEPSAHPGCLAPHHWLPDGSSLYDRFGDGFTLLVTSSEAAEEADRFVSAARRVGFPIEIVIPQSKQLHELYGAKLALVRPDQHVAWRGEHAPRDVAAVLDRVRGATTASVPS